MANLNVQDFFENKNVFITGATGFLGKAVIEKLLRSCPKLGTIYVLIRQKSKHESIQARLDKLFENPVFDTLKARSDGAHILGKVHPMCGDIGLPFLGLSDNDRNLLMSNVSVVIHSAATIKFEEVLSKSVELNINGSRRVLMICKMMKNLQALVHISTAYSNCNRGFIEEKVYPPPDTAAEIVKLLLSDKSVEKCFPTDLDNIMFQTSHPNTYAYTKAITEYVLSLEAENVPVCIVRPSIVTASLKEPIPGWTDNMNGATGIMAGIGIGALRVLMSDFQKNINFMPVDSVANMILCAAWEVSMTGKLNKKCSDSVNDTIPIKVYNCCSTHENPLTNRVLVTTVEKCMAKYSTFSSAIFYPAVQATTNRVFFFWKDVTEQFIPAVIFNMLAPKKNVLKRYWKIKRATKSLAYFTLNEWQWSTGNMKNLAKNLNVDDRVRFNFNMEEIIWPDYLKTYCAGIRRFIMKENDLTLRDSQARMQRLYGAYLFIKIFVALAGVILLLTLLQVFS